MIISPGRQFIFVHIPKTGGTSMAMALEDRAHRDDILIGDTAKAKKRKGRLKGLTPRGRLWKHSTLADIDGILTPEEIGAMFCFTLVRNPWDRVVSYYHWLRGQNFDHAAVHIAQDMGFADFLRHPQITAALRAWPYGRYLTDATGKAHGHFLRLEHLDTDLEALSDHLGFVPDLPHVNRSDRAEYRDYFTDELRDLVGATCAEDIRRFRYNFL